MSTVCKLCMRVYEINVNIAIIRSRSTPTMLFCGVDGAVAVVRFLALFIYRGYYMTTQILCSGLA